MLLVRDLTTSLAAPIEAVPASPPALHATTPLLEALGLTSVGTSAITPADRRADSAHVVIAGGVVAQAQELVATAPRSATAWARLAQALHNADMSDDAVIAARRSLQCLRDVTLSASSLAVQRSD